MSQDPTTFSLGEFFPSYNDARVLPRASQRPAGHGASLSVARSSPWGNWSASPGIMITTSQQPSPYYSVVSASPYSNWSASPGMMITTSQTTSPSFNPPMTAVHVPGDAQLINERSRLRNPGSLRQTTTYDDLIATDAIETSDDGRQALGLGPTRTPSLHPKRRRDLTPYAYTGPGTTSFRAYVLSVLLSTLISCAQSAAYPIFTVCQGWHKRSAA